MEVKMPPKTLSIEDLENNGNEVQVFYDYSYAKNSSNYKKSNASQLRHDYPAENMCEKC
jgi:hypothetical protein